MLGLETIFHDIEGHISNDQDYNKLSDNKADNEYKHLSNFPQ
jgi:hypothetical protein